MQSPTTAKEYLPPLRKRKGEDKILLLSPAGEEHTLSHTHIEQSQSTFRNTLQELHHDTEDLSIFIKTASARSDSNIGKLETRQTERGVSRYQL